MIKEASFSLVVINSKIISVLSIALFALDLKIDQSLVTIIVAMLVAMSSMWQSYMLSKVHTLVNSNFTEAKTARVAAESALKTAQDLNANLQAQLDKTKK